MRHSMLQLQPVVLPPPPDENTQSPEPALSSVTAEDDIALDEDFSRTDSNYLRSAVFKTGEVNHVPRGRRSNRRAKRTGTAVV